MNVADLLYEAEKMNATDGGSAHRIDETETKRYTQAMLAALMSSLGFAFGGMRKGLELPHRDGKGDVGFGPARADKGEHGNRLCASLARGASRGENGVGVLKAIIPSRETNDTNHNDARLYP